MKIVTRPRVGQEQDGRQILHRRRYKALKLHGDGAGGDVIVTRVSARL